MIRTIARRGKTLAFLGIFEVEDNPYDFVDADKEIHFYPNDTGPQRLRNLFRRTQNDDIADPKVISILHMTYSSFIVGGIYGGIQKSREAFINFIEKNEATRFSSHMEAKRKLSDKMFTSFMKGGVKWGLKVSLFCTAFTATYTAISTYQNKDSVLYYTAGGMAAGALYKIPLGPKGMISGGVFGGFFGCIYGGLKYLLLTLSNVTEDELRKQKYGTDIERKEALHRAVQNVLEDEAKKELTNLMLDPELSK